LPGDSDLPMSSNVYQENWTLQEQESMNIEEKKDLL
jgi:hypothetical protein